MGQGQRVGYIRVSSEMQNTARQLDGIQVDRVFEDRLSGKDTNRPQLQAMLEYVREGDEIVCHEMSRLARNLDDLRRLVQELTKRGVKVRFIKEAMIFAGDDSPMSLLMLSMMGAFAEFERSIIKSRVAEGIAQAKKIPGKYAGRKPALSPAQASQLRERVKNGEKKTALAAEYGISRETLYTYLRAGTAA
jgi:DNA invertase Pin-like site-specific DNA recombinase